MDWKYKHFHQERVFPAPRDLVTEAGRTFMAESLGWQITNTPDGFTAEGYSFSHRAIANLHTQSAAGGGSHDESTNPLVLAANKPAAYIFNGCLVFTIVMFALYFVVTFISAVVGLLTGHLFLLGRGSLIIHEIWARILSALILMFGAFLAWRIKRKA